MPEPALDGNDPYAEGCARLRSVADGDSRLG
jgi:hypothetical protein